MYQSHNQSGRVRVNKVREGYRNKRDITQNKKKKIHTLHPFFKVQDELFKDGFDYGEYCNYLQDKINNNKFYYRKLSEDNLNILKERYRNIIHRDNNQYNEIGNIKEINRKRRKQFREKKKTIIYEKKQELIIELFKEMKKASTIGVIKNTEGLSTDPEKWNNTKKTLFTGGRYLDTHDKGWTKIYRRIVSNGTYHLFNIHSLIELNNYIFNYYKI